MQDDGTKIVSCTLNFPLQDGLVTVHASVFRPAIDEVMTRFRPEAVVMCCSADSITG